MTELVLQMLACSALAAFGVVGFMQWLKQLTEIKGKYLALINLALCALSGFALWHGVFFDKKISFALIPVLAVLTFSQLGYEGLVKPLFEKILGVK